MATKAELVCKSCHASTQRLFTAEVAIHFPGLDGLNKPHVFVFPELFVCLECGFTEFTIETKELQALRQEGIRRVQ